MNSRIISSRNIIILSALGCALVVGSVTYSIMRIYRDIHPIWVEQAAYGQWPMMQFQHLVEEHGMIEAIRISLATDDFLLNRHLLEIWILGILAPGTLTWFHAPLLVVFPTFVIFLSLFGWTVYKRTDNVVYSVAAMFLFCSLAQLTRHNWGIGSGFADWQSMFLLSAAALSLINALMEPGIGWIRSFSIFVSLAVLARTTTTFYSAVICGPMLVLYFIDQYKRERSFKPLGVTLINILIIIAPVAAIVISQLAKMFLYYGSVNAWNLHQPFITSANNIFFRLLAPFLGLPIIATCVALFAFNILKGFSLKNPVFARAAMFLFGVCFVVLALMIGRTDLDPSFSEYYMYYLLVLGLAFWAGAYALTRTGVVDWLLAQSQLVETVPGTSEIAIGWWVLGYLGFLLASGYTSDVPKEVMYVVPAFLLGSLAPISYPKLKLAAVYRFLSIGLTVFSVIGFGWSSYENAEFAKTTNSEEVALKVAQRDMARTISSLPADITWQSYTNVDWGIPVSLTTQYEFGEYRQYGGTNFYNKKAYWDTWYPDRSLGELQNELYAQVLNCVDAAVILKDPDQQPYGMEEYSYSIAAYIARNVKADSNWILMDSLNGWPVDIRYQVYLYTIPDSSRSCRN